MTTCAICESPFDQPQTGRKRVYCGDKCRAAARRRPKAAAAADGGALLVAVDEALAAVSLDADARRRVLAIELRSVARELDADPTGRPSLIGAFERLVGAVLGDVPSDVGTYLPMSGRRWLDAVYGEIRP